MKISIPSFRGEAPRVSPRALPENMAASAFNCRLLSSDVDAWKNFLSEDVLCKAGNINSIYLLANQYWLEFEDSDLGAGAVSVDFAKGIIPGDTTHRTYLTGLDVPRFTNVSLASSPVFSGATTWTAATTPTKPTNGSTVGTSWGGNLVSFGGNLFSIGGADNGWTSYGIYKSVDNGSSWTTVLATQPWTTPHTQNNGNQAAANATYIFFINKNDTSGFYECWRSSDSAATWTRVNSSITGGATAKNVGGIFVIGTGLYLFLGQQGGTGAVYKSTNDGTTWVAQTTSPGWGARRGFVPMYIGTTLYVVGGYDGSSLFNDIWQSTNDGVTWTQIAATSSFSARYGFAGFSYNGVMYIAGGSTNAAGSTTVNDVWISSSNGLTWTQATASAAWTSRHTMSYAVHNLTIYIGPGINDTAIRASLYYAAGAIAGACPFPVSTRLLGVPGPSAAPTITLASDSGTTVTLSDTGSSLSSWTLSPQISTGSQVSTVTTDASIGSPTQPSYKLTAFQSYPSPASMVRDAGTADSSSMSYSVDWQFTLDNASSGGHMLAQFEFCASSGGSNGVKIAYNQFLGATIRYTQSNIASVSNLPASTWLRLSATVTRTGDSTCTVTFQLINIGTSAVLDSGSFSANWVGGFLRFLTDNQADTGNSTGTTFHTDNIQIVGSGVFHSVASEVTTSYVYTFVNDLGEESAPSLPSATITASPGQGKIVTTATSATAGYFITTKRIYRAVTGVTGTSFQFVVEQALATATYTDTLTDVQLGEVLATDNWDLPPSDLRGILALPNGVMAGFSKNNLCFSVQNHPHAWPVAFQLSTDFPIVGLGAIDTNVVIATETFPYLASGNDPANYSMTKLEVQQGCVSKRSIGYLKGVGVLYASPDGLISISGNGGVQILTEALFSRKEWQALNPTSFIAAIHDDRYFCFYDLANGDDPETRLNGFAIEAKEGGFGKISLSFHATAVYTNPLTDKLYLVLDENFIEPTTLADSQVNPDAHTVYSFDTFTGIGLTPFLPYKWTSKLHQLPKPTCFRMAQVKAIDYIDITLKVIVNGSQIFSSQIFDNKEFVLPDHEATTIQFSISGTSQVSMVELAEDVMELE